MSKFIVDSLADNLLTLRTSNNNYRNAFQVAASVAPAGLPGPGHSVRGTIQAPAWKLDVVSEGGNYVEPLYGRPRRMQGMVLAVNAVGNELTVQVGYEVTVKLPDRYRAADYPPGTRVGWDNLEVPTFIPEP